MLSSKAKLDFKQTPTASGLPHTSWWLQSMVGLGAPANWVEVRLIIRAPIVIIGLPAIEVDLNAAFWLIDLGYAGHANQAWVHFVLGL